eukprot:1774027-Karenia_brevis.AAC.1
MAAKHRPQTELKEAAIKAYIKSRRPAFADHKGLAGLTHRERDEEVRRLCRVEFNALAIEQQWEWVDRA